MLNKYPGLKKTFDIVTKWQSTLNLTVNILKFRSLEAKHNKTLRYLYIYSHKNHYGK